MLQAVLRPHSLAEAVAALAEPGTGLVAGGTLAVPAITRGTSGLTRVVTLGALAEPLSGVGVADGRVTIGAMTPLARLERTPSLRFLAAALDSIGSPTLRNQATAGGNLFARQPYGDFATCLIALDAEAVFLGAAGERRVPVATAVRDKAQPGEILVRLSFMPPDPAAWRYRKAMRRVRNSAAIVTVAAVVPLAGGRVAGARLALGGVAPTAIRSPAAEAALNGRPLDADTAMAAGEAARGDARPADDAYASAWYRDRVLPVHVRRALIGA
jgi:CO/xanthine dehydrogenase FAD-binding subunit